MPEFAGSLDQARQVALALAEAKPHVRGNCLVVAQIFESILAFRTDFAEFHYAIERNRTRVMELVTEIRREEDAKVYEGKELATLARQVLLANTTIRITDDALA